MLKWILCLAATLRVTSSVDAAVLYVEDFDPNIAGWTGRDGEMTVSHDAVNYWVAGSFAASFLPQDDAFRIDTGTDFLGNYTSGSANHPLTQISFDFYAANVLPSDLFMRIIDGVNTFSYQFTPLNGALMNWKTFTVNLDWSYGWSGLSEAAFNAALTSVDKLEIQIARRGTGAQTFYLDNVRTLNTDIGGGEPGDAVPEPSIFGLILIAAFLIGALRRSRIATTGVAPNASTLS
jgi:hypothetical protein